MKKESTDFPLLPKRKFGWLPDESKLKIFYRILHNAGKIPIDCDFDSFASHFLGTAPVGKKISWLGRNGELIHVFSELMNKKVIPYHRDYILLVHEHFFQRNGTLLNYQSLRVLKSRVSNVLVENFIETLIDDIKR